MHAPDLRSCPRTGICSDANCLHILFPTQKEYDPLTKKFLQQAPTADSGEEYEDPRRYDGPDQNRRTSPIEWRELKIQIEGGKYDDGNSQVRKDETRNLNEDIERDVKPDNDHRRDEYIGTDDLSNLMIIPSTIGLDRLKELMRHATIDLGERLQRYPIRLR